MAHILPVVLRYMAQVLVVVLRFMAHVLPVFLKCMVQVLGFRDDPALVDTALVNAASVKNDVHLWIYTIHTIK